MELLGNKAGTGVALAKCLIIDNTNLVIDKYVMDNFTNMEMEKNKVIQVFNQVLNEYEKMLSNKNNDQVISELIEFYKMILLSSDLKSKIIKLIEEKHYSAIGAIEVSLNEREKQLASINNPYLSERSRDVAVVKEKLLKSLLGIKDVNLTNLTEDVILVAKEIDSGMLLNAKLDKIKGIVSELGSKTSHVAIIANSLGIPTVFGIKDVNRILKNNELIYLDGNKGIVKTNLDNEFKEQVLKDIKREQFLMSSLDEMINKEAITIDGVKYEVAANTGDINELDRLIEINSDGVGLFRTEFLFLNRNEEPSEEELFETYKRFVSQMSSKPFIIRTLDIGGDKKASYINIGKEDNPFLGYRAIRYCLDNKDFFKTSLKAILRASHYGNVMIMYPMISSLSEIEDANLILEEAKRELDKNNIPYNKKIKVGIMVEIPSVAVYADLIIKKVDFFSIGTNDLVQYTLAVDRLNSKVNEYYDWFNPGVIRLIKNVIDSTKLYQDKFVGMCGELAADPLGIILLVGLGLDEFSVNIGSVLKTKKLISLLNHEDAKKIVDEVLNKDSGSEIKKILEDYARQVYHNYY